MNEYTQDFEALFDKNYSRKVGTDEESKQLLRRDLFVQGLLLKRQEKVLPSSATTFADTLYKARMVEEQDRQLAQMHQTSKAAITKLSPKPQTKV